MKILSDLIGNYELTQMFDIDKLYLSTMFWHKGQDGKMTTEYQEGSKEYYANNLIENYLALLTDLDENGKNRTAYIQHASIDGDTKLLTDIVKDLESIQGEYEPLLPYADLTLRQQVMTKNEFITGKFGIGPFALNNNSQILTTLYGVEFSETDAFGKKNILSRLGLTSLHNTADRDGNSIMSWISGLINAHVDVAKDPFISRLGVNKYTYNLTNLLIRTGLGKTTFYMLTLPIMKEFSRAYNTASGLYMLKPGITQSQAQREAVDDVLFKAFEKIGIVGTTIASCEEQFRDYLYDQYKMSINLAIDLLFDQDNDVMHEISKNGLQPTTHIYGIVVDGTKRALTGDEVLLLVAIAKRKFDPYAEALSDLVKYSKIDTNKQGKNITEQRQYLIGYHDLFDESSVAPSRAAFKPDGLDRMSKMSYIETKTLNATSAFISILEGQVLEATHSFLLDLSSILLLINKNKTTSLDLLNKLSRKILIKIKSAYFFAPGGYCEKENIDPKGLVSGDNTICDRLNELHAKILSDDTYSDLRDASGEISNYLLRSLTPSVSYQYNPTLNPATGNRPDTYPNVKFIKLFNFTEEDTIDQDAIIEAWEELLNDSKYPELQKFARDLIVYAFITSGDSGGLMDLFKYVPNSWKLNSSEADYESSYAAYIERLLEIYNNKDNEGGVLGIEDIQDILQNSWYDDDIVITKYDKYINSTFLLVTMSGQSSPSMLIPRVRKDVKDIPYIFKVPRNNANDKYSQRMYDLYIRSMINGRFVWTAIDPKGGKYKNGHYIYEMGRQDAQVEDVIVSLLSDSNMIALAQQLHIPANSIAQFFNDLVHNLEETNGFTDMLVRSLMLPEEILELVDDESLVINNPAENTYDVPQLETLTIIPAKSADKKAAAKGKISNKFIGFADGIEGSSTANYAQQAGDKANTGDYNSNDIIFVSIPGKRGDATIRSVQQELTIEEALKALEAGATLVTDNADYVASSDYNEGEKLLAESLQAAGATYSERVVDGLTLGIWRKDLTLNTTEPQVLPGSESTIKMPIKQLSQSELAIGRRLITPSNRQYITEKLLVKLGNKIYNQSELEQFLSIQNQIVSILFDTPVINPTENYIDVPYTEWKRLLNGNGDNAIGVFTEHGLESALDDGDWIVTDDENFLKYDKNTKVIKIPKVEYEVIKTLSKNPNYIEFLKQINPDSWAEDIMTTERNKYESVGEMVAQLSTNVFVDGFKRETDPEDLQEYFERNDIYIRYTYTDSRQLTLWDDSDEFSDEEMNHCKH